MSSRRNHYVIREQISDLMQGLLSTSAAPAGNYRAQWLSTLRRRPGKNRIPRGFGSLSGEYI